MIRYAVSVIYYEPYIYGKPVPVVWFRNIGEVQIVLIEAILEDILEDIIQMLFPLFCNAFHVKPMFFILQGYLCKLILVLLMYGYVAPVFWMFIEGIYLHSRIATNIFDSPAPFARYYIIGWGKFLINCSM